MKFKIHLFFALIFLVSCQSAVEEKEQPMQVSGIYPHLAYYNNEGECGTGAIVPWAMDALQRGFR